MIDDDYVDNDERETIEGLWVAIGAALLIILTVGVGAVLAIAGLVAWMVEKV